MAWQASVAILDPDTAWITFNYEKKKAVLLGALPQPESRLVVFQTHVPVHGRLKGDACFLPSLHSSDMT